MKKMLYTIILLFASIATLRADDVIYLKCVHYGSGVPTIYLQINKTQGKIFFDDSDVVFNKLIIKQHVYIGKKNYKVRDGTFKIYRDSLQAEWSVPGYPTVSYQCMVSGKRKNKI